MPCREEFVMVRAVLSGSLASLLWLTGCMNEAPRLNAPPHGDVDEVSNMQSTYTYMTDNALLADMTVSDAHFLPHRARLNDTGERRLARLASLLDEYGGSIRLNSDVTDEALVQKRVETVVAFLRDAGLPASAQTVQRDIAGGRGMDAAQAILIKANEGSYQPRGRGGRGNGGGAPTMPGAGR